MKPPRPIHLLWPHALIVLAWAALIALGPARGDMGADAVAPAEDQKPVAPKTDAPPPAAPTPAPAQLSIRIEMESGGVGKVIVSDGRNPPVVRDLKVQQSAGSGATAGIVIQKVKPEGGPAAAEALGQIGDRRAILPLDAASDDCQPGVRRAAAAALRAIIGPLPKPLLPDLPEPPSPITSNEAGR